MAITLPVRVTYTSCDGCRMARKFKTLEGAHRFAVKYVGKHPDFGSHYAISGDGVGKVTVIGCSLNELFPQS